MGPSGGKLVAVDLRRGAQMSKRIKTIISLLIGVPAFFIFAGETSLEYTWMQVLAAAVLVVVFMWNFWGERASR